MKKIQNYLLTISFLLLALSITSPVSISTEANPIPVHDENTF